MTLIDNAAFALPRSGYNSRFAVGRRDMVLRISLIEKFASLTGCSDQEIARLLGISRSAVQAYRSGRLDENLNERQKDALIRAAQAFRQQVYEAVAEMELLS